MFQNLLPKKNSAMFNYISLLVSSYQCHGNLLLLFTINHSSFYNFAIYIFDTLRQYMYNESFYAV